MRNDIIGTSALIKHRNGRFELTKMAVTEKYQGLKIGERLAIAAIKKARSLGEKSIFLETNSKLSVAIGLYKKIGFKNKPYPKKRSEHYQRADTYMVLDF